MSSSAARERLGRILDRAPTVEVNPGERFVIFSDLHLGDGGHVDDCVHNESLLTSVMERYYLDQRFRLVLNGDIEELYKFSVRQITRRWKELYGIFSCFDRETGFYKLAGNHDMVLMRPHRRRSLVTRVHEALNLRLGDIRMFVLHGHQASRVWDWMYQPGRFFFRFVANPLGVRNYSVSSDSRHRYQIETIAYEFARANKMIAIMGHTHRPLFESLSRIDSLKYGIEGLVRCYAEAGTEEREELERKIRLYDEELKYTLTKDRRNGERSSLYDAQHLVPCVFNSGCAVGKRGMTAIEIVDGDIRLVHWFDRKRSTRYFHLNGYGPERLDETDYHRVVLKSESLKYIDTRIQLLS